MLEPAQRARTVADRAPVRSPSNALGPARGVVVFAFGEPHQDVRAALIGFALGEMPVGGGRLDFAAPHLASVAR